MAGEDTELLSPTARRTRRMLLVIASLTLLLRAFPEFRPTGIPAIGIKCEDGVCDAMLIFGSLFLINIYLVVSFVWCALRDFQLADPPRLGAILRAPFARGAIASKLFKTLRAGGSSDPNQPLWGMFNQIRLQVETGLPTFLVAVAWAYVSQAKRAIVDRVVAFWVLDFWFPVSLGIFALTGNWTAAYQLLSRVFVGP